MKIYKYKLTPEPVQTIGENDYIRRILSAGLDLEGNLCVWAEVLSDIDSWHPRRPARVFVTVTGAEYKGALSENLYPFIGTVKIQDEGVIVHVYASLV